MEHRERPADGPPRALAATLGLWTGLACLPVSAAPGDLVLTELMINPACVTDDLGEWLEVSNPTAQDIDLQGFVLADEGSDDYTFPSALVVPAGGRVTLCRQADAAQNGGVACHHAYQGFQLANSEDEVLLRDGSGALVDRVAYSSAAGFSVPAGASLSLAPGVDAAGNDLATAWCAASTVPAAGCGDRGTPGSINDACASPCADGDGDGHADRACGGDDCDDDRAEVHPGADEACLGGLDEDCDGLTDGDDPACSGPGSCGDGVVQAGEGCDDGAAQAGDGCDASCQIEAGWACRAGSAPSLCGSLAAPGAVVVTEIMNNPACVSDDQGEYVELWNPGEVALELRGYSLADDMDSWVLPGLRLEADARALLCRFGDPARNGGLACDRVYTGIQLNNTGDSVNLSDPAGTLVDRVAYDGGPAFPSPSGASLSLEPGADAVANDAGGSWCAAPDPIPGGCNDRGSPGAENAPCQSACPDADGDGHRDSACGGGDCQDAQAGVHPGAVEVCGDGIDQDCQGGDLGCACGDGDLDAHLDASCGGDDCDDTRAAVHPGAAEACANGLDDDCDGSADGQDADCRPACRDEDGDGFDDRDCGGDDCDDLASAIHPDADERCADGLDNDCNDLADRFDPACSSSCQDLDGDGYRDAACGGDDCDDRSIFVRPGLPEQCADGVDNDCDGLADLDDAACAPPPASGCGSGPPGGSLGPWGAAGLWLAAACARRRRRTTRGAARP